jgi:hypothetical protein
MTPTINFENNKPVVFLPAGTKLNRHFKLKQDQFIRVKNLLAPGDTNTKLNKSNKSSKDYKTYGLSLSPHKLGNYRGNRWNNCENASPACINACIHGSGLGGVFESIAISRLCKTIVYQLCNKWFLDRLDKEVHNKTIAAQKQNQLVAIRPNVFSDIAFEDTGIIDNHPGVQWYDYTKNPNRAGALRENYWVTFSRSEINEWHTTRLLNRGYNVAIVFGHPEKRNKTVLPETYKGHEVINGDLDDLRFRDRRGGIVVGLELKTHSLKEYQKAIKSGFPVLTS